ncbi:MAG: site-2 protease family protein [Proteobacteria bacterium]|nr:site-2 protease family protein [Pseudomonadota bacterium]
MKWSWKIATVRGIGIFIHWTFTLLLIWVGMSYALSGAPLPAIIEAIALVLAIFACVILHELGHALTARRYGVGTRDITLLPIGGVARLERIPDRPMQEFCVALAGPAVNVAIAGVLAAMLILWHGVGVLTDMGFVEHSLLAKLFYVNILLVVFNLLPAFPMDGGRVLRAVLAMRLDYDRATQIAATIGQGMAIIFATVGVFYNWFLLFIALFVYIGAQQEAEQTHTRSLLAGARVADAMITRFRTLAPQDSIALAADELLNGDQQHFPVIDASGTVLGVLTRPDLIHALADHRHQSEVAAAMRSHCKPVSAGAPLPATVEEMRQQSCPALPVLHDGRLVGILTLENVGEWLMVRSALRQSGDPMPPFHSPMAGRAA